MALGGRTGEGRVYAARALHGRHVIGPDGQTRTRRMRACNCARGGLFSSCVPWFGGLVCREGHAPSRSCGQASPPPSGGGVVVDSYCARVWGCDLYRKCVLRSKGTLVVGLLLLLWLKPNFALWVFPPTRPGAPSGRGVHSMGGGRRTVRRSFCVTPTEES